MIEQNEVKVSVIVPVFNTGKKYLKKCARSLTEQTLREIEIIFVDDGSGRTTAEYLDELTAGDERAKVIHKENGGVSSARNVGIDSARGEYISFVDSDDWVDADFFECLYSGADNFEAQVISSGYCKEYGRKTEKILMAECEYQIFSRQEEPEMMTFNPYDMRTMGFSTMKIYRRDIIGEKRFKEKLSNGEDVEFNFRIYRDAKRMLYINKPYYHYRILEGSAVRTFDAKAVEKYTKTLESIKATVVGEKDESSQAYTDFIAISYIVLCMNNIFTRKSSYKQAIKNVRELSETSPFKEAVENALELKLPISRKMALICAKYRFYAGVAFIIKTKQFMDRIHS